VRLRLVALAAVMMALAGCGGDKVLATVGDQQVTKKQVDDGIAFLEREAQLEGRGFPEQGTPAREQARGDLLALLIRRARFEAKAEGLGVGVTRQEVQLRVGGEESSGATPPGFAYHEASVRAALLYGKIYDRVTARVTVSAAAVRRFYDRHRGVYTQPFAEVRETLHAQLVAQRKTTVMKAWEQQAERDLPAELH
jgi:hypothetical protein